MVDLNFPNADDFVVGPATVECVIQSAGRQAVPANVLLGLASIEGGKNGQMVRNKNGSFDVAHFQINTNTYRIELAPNGVKMRDLQWKGCYNAEMAALLLKKRLTENSGQDFWTKAANYHNRKPQFNSIYRKKLVALSTEWASWLQQSYSVVNVSYK